MQFNLVVFEPAAAPGISEAFGSWVREQTDWANPDQHVNPDVTAPAVRDWFMGMIRHFPPNSGPFELPGWRDRGAWGEYHFAPNLATVTFSEEMDERIMGLVFDLALRHRVGVFDRAGDGTVWIPRETGVFDVAMTVRYPEPAQEAPAAKGGWLSGLFGRRG